MIPAISTTTKSIVRIYSVLSEALGSIHIQQKLGAKEKKIKEQSKDQRISYKH